MLQLHFRGYFQCRLATDPDPAEETRGVSGFTFAVGDEPDLDRVIRFHDPVAPRSHGPEVGVFVRSVSLNGLDTSDHPLLGAKVELLDDPVIESRNYVLRESSQGPIVPFRLRITEDAPVGQGMAIEREDLLFPEDPDRELHRIPVESMVRRGSWIPMTIDQVRIFDAIGITDPVAFREQRRQLLEQDLAVSKDPVEQAALGKRIAELRITDRQKLQVLTLMLHNDYRFDLNGPSRIDDPQAKLGAVPDSDVDWPLAFWMGGWDSDALCGFVSGVLKIPSQVERTVE